MKYVSITSQGQLTIPKQMLKEMGIKDRTQALITRRGKKLIVEPKKSFWDLEGSLFNGIVLSDKELRAARDAFEKEWPRKM